MGLTRNLKRIGMAAHIENVEMREEIITRREEFATKYWVALEELKKLDPDGWESWFWSCSEQTCGEMLPVIVARIEELSHAPNVAQPEASR